MLCHLHLLHRYVVIGYTCWICCLLIIHLKNKLRLNPFIFVILFYYYHALASKENHTYLFYLTCIFWGAGLDLPFPFLYCFYVYRGQMCIFNLQNMQPFIGGWSWKPAFISFLLLHPSVLLPFLDLPNKTDLDPFGKGVPFLLRE